MSNRIHFHCPACSTRLRAPLRLVGQACPCPTCNHAVKVRPCAPDEEGPILVDISGGQADDASVAALTM